MNKTLSIQLKGAFLLIIFTLNMIVGFACAIGVDMGFNSEHHDEKVTGKVHVHADGKKHHHDAPKHTHEEKKNDCCNDRVVKISQADKAIPQNVKIFSPVFFTSYIAAFYDLNISSPSQAYVSNKYFARGNHPPIPDIRIAIQSFQI